MSIVCSELVVWPDGRAGALEPLSCVGYVGYALSRGQTFTQFNEQRPVAPWSQSPCIQAMIVGLSDLPVSLQQKYYLSCQQLAYRWLFVGRSSVVVLHFEVLWFLRFSRSSPWFRYRLSAKVDNFRYTRSCFAASAALMSTLPSRPTNGPIFGARYYHV